MPSSESSDRGNVAERAAARKYRLEGADEQTGWFDLRAKNGTKYQVKSAQYYRNNGNPGKFRFWREHFGMLHSCQSAVILVLTSSDDPSHVLRVEKVSTSTVADAIAGRWYPSGHADEGEQYKLPWPDVLEGGPE